MELSEGALDLFIQVMDKDIKQGWALGNPTSDLPAAGCNSLYQHSLAQPSSQFFIQWSVHLSKPSTSSVPEGLTHFQR